jgi:hypothetical protein
MHTPLLLFAGAGGVFYMRAVRMLTFVLVWCACSLVRGLGSFFA